MVGPRISVHLAGTRIALGVIDIVLAALVLSGVLRERLEPHPRLILAVPAGIALTLLCLFTSFGSERLRQRVNRSGPSALPAILTLPTTNGPTVSEAKSTAMAARGGIAGMGIDLAIGLIAIAAYLLFEGSDRTLENLIVVAAIAIGGSAAIRFLASPSLNGGRVARWMFEFTLDDEESALRATRVVGYGVAAILFLVGLLLLTSEGEGGFWGIGLAAAGIDVGVLATLSTRQTEWLQVAGDRKIGDLLEAPHALVSGSSSLDEMMSVLSVDGPSAIAVVRDGNGNPAGVMQFQQMRAAVRGRGTGVTIADVMIPIQELPEVQLDTTLLDAVQVLLESGRPAVRFENGLGKMAIATARDLGLPK